MKTITTVAEFKDALFSFILDNPPAWDEQIDINECISDFLAAKLATVGPRAIPSARTRRDWIYTVERMAR